MHTYVFIYIHIYRYKHIYITLLKCKGSTGDWFRIVNDVLRVFDTIN